MRFVSWGRSDTLAPGSGAPAGGYAGSTRPASRPTQPAADEFAPPGDLHDEDIPF
ncbi:MAG: hypothetical protein HZY76_06550 [Anaerolineae bacterium]|nr:MAG: hypothetical protein HZY76_06550 [Anaerolineae bacterium]